MFSPTNNRRYEIEKKNENLVINIYTFISNKKWEN